jgi:hypothetical protein
LPARSTRPKDGGRIPLRGKSEWNRGSAQTHQGLEEEFRIVRCTKKGAFSIQF